ncbi:succinate--CoA ligase subunit alpha [Candidatus Giovannonibacteria bacterium]|nr:succinate--CoA ligase subunit alpha [Candidatus Giovannonibacteria bacterium]
MSLLLRENAKIIGQGITGSEGQRALPWMRAYGTNIVAGVTPGKGGEILDGVPIFNTVKDAVQAVGQVDGSVMFVPPLFSKGAVTEAMESGIKFVLIGAEKVPTKDAAIIYSLSRQFGASVLGPSSVGFISPHNKIKIGAIGGADPSRVFVDGNVAVISKSGGMTSEISLHLKNNDLGVSYAAGIGGERIICTDFADFLLALEDDPMTTASVIFGELGGTAEERVAELVSERRIKKKVVAFIAGDFAAVLPNDVQFGHAGAIIEGRKGTAKEKRRVLREAGVLVAEHFDDIAGLIKKS